MKPSGRLQELDGLRGLAVLLVVLAHYYGLVEIAGAWRLNYALKHLFALSGTGVDLFFVLSGFLVGGILLDNAPTRNLISVFLTRRAFRILPAYLLLLGSFVVAARTLPGSAELHTALFGPAFPVWSQAVFLQNEMMAWYRQIGPWWLAVTWSVAIETHFYLFAPFLLRACSRRTLLRAALAAMVGVLLLRVFAIQVFGGAHWASYATLARVDGLMLGVALAIGWRSGAFRDAVQRKIVFLRTLAAALFAAGMLVGFSEQLSNPLVSIALVPTIASLFWALVIVVTLQSGATLWGAGLRSRLLTGMGAISYFVYLFHLPVLYMAHAVLFDREPVHLSSAEMATTAGSFIAVVVLGAASWFTIERPAIRRGHQFRYDSA